MTLNSYCFHGSPDQIHGLDGLGVPQLGSFHVQNMLGITECDLARLAHQGCVVEVEAGQFLQNHTHKQ